jgi:hypothetical protein
MTITAAVPGLGHAQAPFPVAVRRDLTARYPRWHFAAVAPEYRTSMPRGASAAYVAADFDGDGRRDFAVQVVRPAERDSLQLVIVFLRRGASYRPVDVDSFPVSTIIYLAPARSGAERADFDADPNGTTRVKLRHDGLDIIYAESAASTCSYEAGRFRCFVSAD